MKDFSHVQRTQFKKETWRYFRSHKRDFPWRKTRDPYKILVSEIMLQQTQTDRVIKYYHSFLKQFPNVQSLTRAPLPRILSAWQGLGYNRRALYLKKLSEIVVKKYRGRLPADSQILKKLPGIGEATAGALHCATRLTLRLCSRTYN